MQRFARLILILAVITGPLTVLLLLLLTIINRSVPLWCSANLIAAIDKTLGAWTIFPPIISWMLAGLVVGSCVYFAVWESHKLSRPGLRRALILFSCAFIAIPPLVWPQLELQLGAPLFLHRIPSAPRAGETHAFDGIEFVWIPAGRFRMGSMPAETGRDQDEYPHVVTLTNGFWLSRYEITQAQWAAAMETAPSATTNNDGDYPIRNISWLECMEFVRRLNDGEETPYRLPTEAEWEYACRAGSRAAYCFGDDAAALGSHAWYADNSRGTPQVVGQKTPNAWGLHDMHGNVREWCLDFYGPYPTSRVVDPMGPRGGRYPALRGGSYCSTAADCRSARRFVVATDEPGSKDDVGVRIVRAFSPADIASSQR